jgi:hypothetical protein
VVRFHDAPQCAPVRAGSWRHPRVLGWNSRPKSERSGRKVSLARGPEKDNVLWRHNPIGDGSRSEIGRATALGVRLSLSPRYVMVCASTRPGPGRERKDLPSGRQPDSKSGGTERREVQSLVFRSKMGRRTLMDRWIQCAQSAARTDRCTFYFEAILLIAYVLINVWICREDGKQCFRR